MPPKQNKSKKTESKVVVEVSPVVKDVKISEVSVSAPVVLQAETEKEKPKRTRKPKQTASTVNTEESTASSPVASPTTTAAVEQFVMKIETAESLQKEISNEINAVIEGVDSGAIEASLAEQSQNLFASLQKITNMVSEIKSNYRTLEKKWARELKTAQKVGSKRKRKAVNRAPSGFVKPTRISDELAVFLNKPLGTEMARTAVTREINTYIRANSLQDKENGRKIHPDANLTQLLQVEKTDELTYFNLQRFMSRHFEKKGTVLATASVATGLSSEF